MDTREHNGSNGRETAVHDWGNNAEDTLARRFSPGEPRRSRGAATIRTVTPDPAEVIDDAISILESPRFFPRLQTSPRSIPGGEKPREKRQGLVFHDSYSSDSIDKPSQDPLSAGLRSRPRTYTVDATTRQRSGSGGAQRNRRRIGSIHSTNSSSFHDIEPRVDTGTSVGYSSGSNRNTLTKSISVRKSRENGRRSARQSQPNSPPQAYFDVPTVDSFPAPIPTGDAKKVLHLMKTLCGRMRGEVEYQTVQRGPWYTGMCYIDGLKGSLMYEDDDKHHKGQFDIAVVTDLRGCKVMPIMYSFERQVRCIELTNPSLGLDIRILPVNAQDFDPWLAAFLAWQQVRLSSFQPGPLRSPANQQDERRPVADRRGSSYSNRDSSVIKVGKLLLWDKGASLSPESILTRPSTRHLRSSGQQWRRVSCVLGDNGDLKISTENDAVLLTVVQLPQLSRSAIQKLDKSVLGEGYCVAIFPQYTPNSTTLSIFRPLYLALESRVVFEVWLCLLRAFTIPEIYGPDLPSVEDREKAEGEPGDFVTPTSDMFRIEKSLSMRIIEAKFRKPGPVKMEIPQYGRHSVRSEPDAILGDYFAEVMLDGEVRARTMTKYETRNPFWREECAFSDLPPYLPKLAVVLKRMETSQLTVHGFLTSASTQAPEQQVEVICGSIEVPVEKLERGKDNETWWPILDHNQEQVGELLMKVRQDEVVVLLAKDYQPISDLLHNFNNSLTVQIAQVMPHSLRQLSEIFCNIYQVSGSGMEWLKAMVEDEIDGVGKETPSRRARWSRRVGSNEASFGSVDREQSVRDMGKSLNSEANLLFRGNSLLTQSLDFHMRRVGNEYLSEILGDQIRTINSINPDCEVDPSRIDNIDHFDKNWTLLIELTTDVWRSIQDSATRCPPELRQVFKYIRAVTEDRYGNFLRTVSYTSISGFLFLRFFCPAILNPKLFGLLPDHPQPKAQRTFTLIAKSLQALANLSSFGQKEAWMEPMNKFLQLHRQGVKDFLDAICTIPPERITFGSPGSYSTPLNLLSRLPPTSQEGFPSLPYLIDQARSFADLIKLWLEGTTQVTNAQLDGDLAEFNDICILLKKRTDDCIVKAEEYDDRREDSVSLQFEDIVEGLQSAYLREHSPAPQLQQQQQQLIKSQRNSGSSQTKQPILSQPWLDYSMTTSSAGYIPIQLKAPGSAGSGSERTKEKEKKNFWEATFGKDSKYQRPYAPAPSLDPAQSQIQASTSPPNKGHSRADKASRSFLGLRRKGKSDKEPKSQGSGSSQDGGAVAVAGAMMGITIETQTVVSGEDVTSPMVASWGQHGGMF